jgi:polyhydroxybutyrate depolymerase
VHRLTAGLLALALLAGCSSDDVAPEDADTAPTPVTSPCPPVSTADPGVPNVSRVQVDGETRSYRIQLPRSYDEAQPSALILNWHGNSSNAVQQQRYTGLGQVADAVVVAPQGTGDPRHFSLVPGPENPDIGFARAILEQVSGRLCIDPNRIFSTGISNGSGLSSEIACQAPEVFAAVALVAATIGPLGCDADVRIPILAFHGTADPVVPYEGGRIATNGIQVPSAEEGIRRWAEQNRCDPEPTVEQIGDDVVHWTFESCEADVEAYWIQGGGHVWPGAVERPVLGSNTETIDASALISEWFEDHPRAG